MKKLTVLILGLILSFFCSGFEQADAAIVKITTDKSTYAYGEFLSFTIEVSEITGSQAIMHIRDENGKESGAIPIEITSLKTTIPSKIPFDSEIYPIGKYYIDIEYSGTKVSTEFNLVEAEGIVIPYSQKFIIAHWVMNDISDEQFLQSIKSLVEKKVLAADKTDFSEHHTLPSWIKVISQWMLEGKISDNDYGIAIQYLIKTGIIVI